MKQELREGFIALAFYLCQQYSFEAWEKNRRNACTDNWISYHTEGAD